MGNIQVARMCEPLPFITFCLETGKKAKEIGDLISRPTPTKAGFLSAKYGLFPLDLILQLNKVSYLTKLQLMAHKEFVSKSVKIFFGNVPGGKAISQRNATFTNEPVGTIEFENPDAVDRPNARELKTVEVGEDEPISFVKLRLSANYPTKNNKYNQVGIVGIKLFGRPVDQSEEEEDNLPYGNIGHDLVTLVYIDREIVDFIQKVIKSIMVVAHPRMTRQSEVITLIGKSLTHASNFLFFMYFLN